MLPHWVNEGSCSLSTIVFQKFDDCWRIVDADGKNWEGFRRGVSSVNLPDMPHEPSQNGLRIQGNSGY